MARAAGWRAAAALVAVACLAAAVKAQTFPGDPQGSYRAAYGYVVCEPAVTLSPTTTQGVAYAVKQYISEAQKAGKILKIRASRHKFHTTTSLACPDQQYALQNATGKMESHDVTNVMAVAILHDRMDKVLEFDPVKFTMTVGAGMRINQLLPEATKVNMSVMAGALPAYAGLTLGGVFVAGAHGTGDMTISTIADMISEVTWVDGKGEIRKTGPGTADFRALSSGVGLTGIVTELKLQMTPPTNTKLITRYLSNDTTMFEDIDKMLKHAPHILVFWRPDFQMYSAYMMKPTDISVPATDDYMTLLPSFKGRGQMAKLYRGFQGDIYDANMPMVSGGEQFMCPTVAFHSVAKTWANKRDGTPVLYTVAPTNNLVASECDDQCAWNGPQYNGTAEDVHMAIEWDQFKDWIADMKSIVQKDLWGESNLDASRCMGPGYIWLRFGHPRDENLHMAYGMKRPVYVQSTWLRSRSMGSAPMRFGWLTDLLEEVTLCKYNGRPHWGKNYLRTFTHPKCPLRGRYPAFGAQLEQQAKHDPAKIYEPNIWTQIAAGQAYKYYPGCALNKDCFCTADEHCAAGMKCVPSLAFPDLTICKPNWDGYKKKAEELSGWLAMVKRWHVTGNALSSEKYAAHVAILGRGEGPEPGAPDAGLQGWFANLRGGLSSGLGALGGLVRNSMG